MQTDLQLMWPETQWKKEMLLSKKISQLILTWRGWNRQIKDQVTDIARKLIFYNSLRQRKEKYQIYQTNADISNINSFFNAARKKNEQKEFEIDAIYKRVEHKIDSTGVISKVKLENIIESR